MHQTSKDVIIEKNPWGKSINKEEIDVLLKRLNDTPETLYKAFQRRRYTEQLERAKSLNKNKFHLLEQWSSQKTKPFEEKTTSRLAQSKFSNDKKSMSMEQKSTDFEREGRILKKIQAQKRRYI